VLVQVKIVKADIPEDYLGKVMLRTNEAMDKYQIEKVGSLCHPPPPHYFVTNARATCFSSRVHCIPQFCVSAATSNCPQDMATYVKKKCDEEFGGTWHCCFGRNFGCSITHDTKYVLFFQVELMHVLLFKSLE